jgi:signal peptidase I
MAHKRVIGYNRLAAVSILNMRINLREVVIAILIFVLVFAVVQISVGSYRVEMASMTPTFLPNECIMVDKLTYRFTTPHRGQVVVLWPPVVDDELPAKNPYIKRVVGLPGETVRVDETGQVHIRSKGGDEFKLVEKPEMPLCAVRNRSWTLGSGEYFVLGDNRGYSQDSTKFGPVKRGKFVGKTWLRYWPLSRFGLTPHYRYKLESTSTGSGVLPAAESPGLAVSTP